MEANFINKLLDKAIPKVPKEIIKRLYPVDIEIKVSGDRTVTAYVKDKDDEVIEVIRTYDVSCLDSVVLTGLYYQITVRG